MASVLDASAPHILTRFRDELFRNGNPLVADEQVWQETAQQAREVIADCELSLESGRAREWAGGAQPTELDRRRATAGISPRYAVAAGSVLFRLVLEQLAAVADGRPGGIDQLALATGSLQQSIATRLETAVVGHDQVLLERINRAQETAQRSLARVIHDELGNTVSLAMRHLELFEHLRPATDRSAESRPADTQLAAAKESLVESLQRIRDIVTFLRREERAGSLEQALKLFLASAGIARPEFELHITGDESWAPQHVLDEVFLAVRECLRNALAHAHAEWIWVDIAITAHSIAVSVVDDGVGFDVPAALKAGANGLTSITERIELLGGMAAICGIPLVGTRVAMSIPLPGWADAA
ncbi:histidine kinase [Kitasatospora sp. GP82]|uniref:sensor histidine kinase n=1 Tax=Kitasatospora sp. GP82 TaxID=3035089 RepID=UPI002475C224|nr:histidine kinase [Kitasatospora sp. GP82]